MQKLLDSGMPFTAVSARNDAMVAGALEIGKSVVSFYLLIWVLFPAGGTFQIGSKLLKR